MTAFLVFLAVPVLVLLGCSALDGLTRARRTVVVALSEVELGRQVRSRDERVARAASAELRRRLGRAG